MPTASLPKERKSLRGHAFILPLKGKSRLWVILHYGQRYLILVELKLQEEPRDLSELMLVSTEQMKSSKKSMTIKNGGAALTPERINQIRANVPNGANVQIHEVR